MRDDGVERAVGIVMAPHWSGMSVERYVDRVLGAVDDLGGGVSFSFVRSYHAHPSFVKFLAARVSDALAGLEGTERSGAMILFTAHSLPTRVVDDGSLRCKTCDCVGLVPVSRRSPGDGRPRRPGARARELRDRVAECGTYNRSLVGAAGPGVDPRSCRHGSPVRGRVLGGLRRRITSRSSTTSTSKRRPIAEGAGIRFARTTMPNADPEYLDVLAEVVRDHLAGAPAA